jgi:uncharacterized protein YjiS (DUF1127 family)
MNRHFTTPASALLAAVADAFKGLFREVGRVVQALEHRREIKALAELDERTLKDIGLLRSDVDGALAEPFFRNPSLVLVRTVGRRPPAPPAARRARRPLVPLIREAE